MRFECEQEVLSGALSLIAGVAKKNSLRPILSMVKLDVSAGAMVLEATDYDQRVKVSVAADASTKKSDGAVLVPADKFARVVSGLGAGTVVLEGKKSKLHFTHDKAKGTLQTGDNAEDFPSMSGDVLFGFSLTKRAFLDIVDRVAFAASDERSRYSLNGVYLKVDGKKVVAAATDGRQLAVFEVPVNGEAEFNGILPKSSVAMFKKAVNYSGLGDEDVLDISGGENHMMVTAGDVEVATRLVEGKFPDYARVIPKKAATKIKVSKETLLDAIRRVSTLNPDNAINVTVGDGTLEFRASQTEVGDIETSLEAEVDGEGLDIVFNARYLSDGVKAMGDDTVVLNLNDSESAAKLKERGYTFVVMPVSG